MLEVSLGNTVGTRPYLEEETKERHAYFRVRTSVLFFAICAHKNISKKTQLFVLLRYITPTPLLLSYLCVGENISESSLEKLLKRQPKK